jgi:hypothetical protein
MPDVLNEIKTSEKTDHTANALREEAFKGGAAHGATKNELAVTKPAEIPAFKGMQGVLPTDLEKNLKDLQQSLEKTQKQIAELQKTCGSNLYDNELASRSMIHNPYKILTAGSGLAMLTKSHGLAAIPLTGFAGLQGYDDFKSLREQTTFAGRGKYTLGLLADTAVGAGSLAFLTDSVPMKYKAPMLAGGLLVRAAIDFIPNKKK